VIILIALFGLLVGTNLISILGGFDYEIVFVSLILGPMSFILLYFVGISGFYQLFLMYQWRKEKFWD
jgi:hypothetical protein